MGGDILYACSATEVNAHKRTDNLAILMTTQCASHAESGMYYIGLFVFLCYNIFSAIAARASEPPRAWWFFSS